MGQPLRKAIQIDPDYAEAHFVLGTALRFFEPEALPREAGTKDLGRPAGEEADGGD